VVDHQRIGPVETAEGPRVRVVLVAAYRDAMDRMVTALRKAGLRPAGIDLSAFALIRALRGHGEEPTLYAHLSSLTTIAIAEGAACGFTRVSAVGHDMLIRQLGERRGLTLEHARGWLDYVGLVQPLEEIEGDPEVVSSARELLERGTQDVAAELRAAADFYAGQSEGGHVGSAVLAGELATVPGFGEAVAERSGLAVTAGSVAIADGGAVDGLDARVLPVAAGLSVEEVPVA